MDVGIIGAADEAAERWRSASSSTPTRSVPMLTMPRGRRRSSPTTPNFVVYHGRRGLQGTDELHGRESLTPVFDNLNTYEVTMHLNGQNTVALELTARRGRPTAWPTTSIRTTAGAS